MKYLWFILSITLRPFQESSAGQTVLAGDTLTYSGSQELSFEQKDDLQLVLLTEKEVTSLVSKPTSGKVYFKRKTGDRTLIYSTDESIFEQKVLNGDFSNFVAQKFSRLNIRKKIAPFENKNIDNNKYGLILSNGKTKMRIAKGASLAIVPDKEAQAFNDYDENNIYFYKTDTKTKIRDTSKIYHTSLNEFDSAVQEGDFSNWFKTKYNENATEQNTFLASSTKAEAKIQPKQKETKNATHQINGSVDIQNLDGDLYNLNKGSRIKFINTIENFDKWYQEFEIIDEENTKLYEGNFKASKKYIYDAIAQRIEKSLPIKLLSGNTVMAPKDSRYVILSKENDNSYNVVLIDDDGNIIDHKGNRSMQRYQISSEIYDRNVLNIVMNELLDETNNKEVNKIYCNEPLAPHKNGANKELFWNPNFEELEKILGFKDKAYFDKIKNDPYLILVSKRNLFKNFSHRKCEIKLRNFENQLLELTSWKGVTVLERANKIHDIAKRVEKDIQDLSKQSGKESLTSSPWKNYINGHYMHEIISPEVVSCITFQETEGFLNPISYNYSYCNKTRHPSSLAIGLGQMTRTTMNDMIDPKEDNMNFFPMGSSHSDIISEHILEIPKASNKNIEYNIKKQVHSALLKSPELQIETIFRTLNEKAKLVENQSYYNKEKLTSEELLLKMITNYDQDRKKKYVDNVHKCIKCFQAGKTASRCYQELEDR